MSHTHESKNHDNHHAAMAEGFKKKFFVALVVSIPVLILSPSIQNWFGFSIGRFFGYDYVLFALASIIAVYTAWPFYKHGLDELKTGQPGMMVLVSLAILAGYLYSAAATFFIDANGFYWEISTLTLVLLLGHWLEMRAVIGASGSLRELVKLIPPKANRIKKDENTEFIETENLKIGDIILIKPGEKIPIDSKVVDGSSSVNESFITGEARPVAKETGDMLVGGSLNINGSLVAKVVKVGKDTALSQIIELVKNAQNSKPKTQKIADRAARYLTIIALVVGVSTFFIWNFWLGATFVLALTFAITVIVITCPHALGLAIPTVTTIATSLAAKNGILIKNMNGLEKAKDVDWILFDKTGTLTNGNFTVSDIVGFDIDKNELLLMVASLERNSEHTIAQAIVKKAFSEKLRLNNVGEFKSISGQGVVGRINGKRVMAGTIKLMRNNKININNEQLKQMASFEDQGATVIYVSVDGNLSGAIALADEVKSESKKTLSELRALGKNIAMITGDSDTTAKRVANELGIEKFFSRVLPSDKVDKVKELQNAGARVMMVGDGVNDAPALTQAEIGVAIGTGTDVAAASSEIILIKNNLLDIVKLLKLSKATVTKMKQNLGWAVGYNIIAIPLAAGVLSGWGIFLRPEWGAIAMTLSSVIVVINALLLKKIKL